MSREKQRQLDEINRSMNEELFNNLEKQYQELAKVKAESEQIEEMALIICGRKDCTDCISRMGLRKCGAKAYAERFYNAGYRKQSEGEWIVEEHPLVHDKKISCSCCGYSERRGPAWNISWGFHSFCPNCGAHMSGGNIDE